MHRRVMLRRAIPRARRELLMEVTESRSARPVRSVRSSALKLGAKSRSRGSGSRSEGRGWWFVLGEIRPASQ